MEQREKRGGHSQRIGLEGGAGGWARAVSRTSCLSPPNTISSNQKGSKAVGVSGHNPPQKRHRDIDCHTGTRPKLKRPLRRHTHLTLTSPPPPSSCLPTCGQWSKSNWRKSLSLTADWKISPSSSDLQVKPRKPDATDLKKKEKRNNRQQAVLQNGQSFCLTVRRSEVRSPNGHCLSLGSVMFSVYLFGFIVWVCVIWWWTGELTWLQLTLTLPKRMKPGPV